MNKPNIRKWGIALCALAALSFTTATSNAGLLDQFGSALFGRGGGHPQPGDDRGRGGHGKDDPTGDDRGGLRGGHGADDSSVINSGRGGGGGGRGGHDDPPGHH